MGSDLELRFGHFFCVKESCIRKLPVWWGEHSREKTASWKDESFVFRCDAAEGQEGRGHLAEGRLKFMVVWRNSLSEGNRIICCILRNNGGKWAGILLEYLNSSYSKVAYLNANKRSL